MLAPTNGKSMKCYNCKKEFKKLKYGRSKAIEVVLLLTTWWLLLLPLWFYYAFAPRWVCPSCGVKLMK